MFCLVLIVTLSLSTIREYVIQNDNSQFDSTVIMSFQSQHQVKVPMVFMRSSKYIGEPAACLSRGV